MAQFQLVMRSGPTPGVTFPLEGDQLTIGRDAINGVAINDSEVSRKHARLMFQGGKYVLEDLGSTNGTFVNGQRLAGPVVLKSGDVVSLGEQIVLMYDAISVDAGATVAVSRKAVQAAYPSAPAPVASAPVSTPYTSAPQFQPAPKKKNMAPILIAVGVLLFICLCAGFFFWVDSTYRWCVFFPFISGC